MTAQPLRILFLADTHLGEDEPLRPKVRRRRRGPDFFASFDRALTPVWDGQADLVIHGGDLFFRSRVRPDIVHRALERIRAVSDAGIPVIIVPGNHERSALPMPLFWKIPRVTVFDRPRTVCLQPSGFPVAISGFPFVRDHIASEFPRLVESTGWREAEADIRLLCIHQIVEGAAVGPGRFVFRGAPDVIPGGALPRRFDAVLSGHIHRHQILRHDLAGRPLPSPVFYPGSTERTSFAEMDEQKGYLILSCSPGERSAGERVRSRFVQLPARPMVDLELHLEGLSPSAIADRLKRAFDRLDRESIVRLTVTGEPDGDLKALFRADSIRQLHPPTMNLQLRWPDRRSR